MEEEKEIGVALPSASVIIVNSNGLPHLQRCLTAITQQNYDKCEILVIDNASTDGSVKYIEREFPSVRIVRNQSNLGYAGANNIGFAEVHSEYIAVLNPDTEVHPDWLRELVLALHADRAAGLATPQILMMDQPGVVNTCGNDITLTGFTFCRGLDSSVGTYNQLEVVSAVSGAAFVIRQAVLEEIGGFDEAFFMYFEETDLSLRAALAGYTCLYVPTAIVLHKYDFRFSARKCYLQERNRYFSLFKTFRAPTLFALLPEFALAEAISWSYAAMKGREHLHSKLQSYMWLLLHWREIRTAHCQVQTLRRVGDRAILRRFSNRLSFTRTVNSRLARRLETTVNPILLVLGLISRAVVRW